MAVTLWAYPIRGLANSPDGNANSDFLVDSAPLGDFPRLVPDRNGNTQLTINKDLNSNGKANLNIDIVNEQREEPNRVGDMVLALKINPNTTPLAGFSQEIYEFQESDPPPNSERGNTRTPFQVEINTGSSIRTAYVVKLDDERPNRRTEGTNRADSIDLRGRNNSDTSNDTVYAKRGNDIVYAGKGDDIVFGQQGNDTLWGNEGNDYLIGGDGRDSLVGGEGNDYLDGGAGIDTLVGGTGNDIYVVDNINDRIVDSPNTGVETVRAAVNWTLAPGLDYLFLTDTAERGIGNSFNNQIYGNELNNYLEGLDGNDEIEGKRGNDNLLGGNGNDDLDGGDGADIFLFNNASEGIDIIRDFNSSEGDKIQISGSGFGATSTNQFSYNSSTGALVFDASPFDTTAPIQFATLQAGINFIASRDITLI